MNEGPRSHLETIGNESIPVLIVEGLDQATEPLRKAARQGRFKATSTYYPGVRAPAPRAYAEQLAKLLEGPVREAFGWQDDNLAVMECDFSLVTTPPGDLSLFQRLPHFDGTSDDVLAVLHFLCDGDHGGTSFYRHRSTGYESISPDRWQAYDEALRADIERLGEPDARYRDESDSIYERMATFDCRPGRALVYRGTTLHSGRIPPDHGLSDDPSSGRLTVNTFIERRSVRP